MHNIHIKCISSSSIGSLSKSTGTSKDKESANKIYRQRTRTTITMWMYTKVVHKRMKLKYKREKKTRMKSTSVERQKNNGWNKGKELIQTCQCAFFMVVRLLLVLLGRWCRHANKMKKNKIAKINSLNAHT